MTYRVIIGTMAALAIAYAVEPRGKEARVANERVQEAGKVFAEIMDAPDKGVPRWVMQRAHCAAIIPGMKNGGFIFGARYGKGVITCRDGRGGWTAPSTVRIEGGSFGLQIGGGEVDVLLFVMNEDGKNKLMKSKFTLGGEAAAMGGPIGRTAKAETDAWMHAKILSYSRSRGVFAGVVVEGATLRPDNDDNNALYGRPVTSGEILNGHYAAPRSARALITSLRRHSRYEL